MKNKTTMKHINVLSKTLNKPIIQIGYCGAQWLLRDLEPNFYTAGIYGWNADIYILDDVIICTGYRPFGTPVNYPNLNEYENSAQILAKSCYLTMPREYYEAELAKLRNEFIKEFLSR